MTKTLITNGKTSIPLNNVTEGKDYKLTLNTTSSDIYNPVLDNTTDLTGVSSCGVFRATITKNNLEENLLRITTHHNGFTFYKNGTGNILNEDNEDVVTGLSFDYTKPIEFLIAITKDNTEYFLLNNDKIYHDTVENGKYNFQHDLIFSNLSDFQLSNVYCNKVDVYDISKWNNAVIENNIITRATESGTSKLTVNLNPEF